jgi:uncharacterized membrane protein
MPHKRNWLKNSGVQDAIVVFSLGCALFFYSLKEHYGWGAEIENYSAREWKLSAYLFPALIAVFLMLLAVSLLLESIAHEKAAGEQAKQKKRIKLKPVFLLIVLSIAYYFALQWKLPAYLLPALIAVFLLLLYVSLLQEIGSLLKESIAYEKPARESARQKKRIRITLKSLFILIVLSIAYYFFAFGLQPLRFLPSTIIFLALLMFLLGERRVLRITFVSITAALVIYAVFALALKVKLP